MPPIRIGAGTTPADYKASCRVCTTANVTISTALNAGDFIDGVALAEGDRVLVANQSATKENGIWIAKASPSRAADADAEGDLSGGTMVYVEEGALYAERVMRITTNGSITPGTTSHEWSPLTPKNFGIVEALPTSEALKGDVCTYKTSQTGVYWLCIYTASESYWNVVGGPPMVASSNVERAINVEAYTSLATDPLKITAPLAGDYDMTIEATLNNSATTRSALLSYAIGATAASDNWAISNLNVGSAELASFSVTTRQTGVAAAANVEEKARRGTGEVFFGRRRLRIMPIRVK